MTCPCVAIYQEGPVVSQGESSAYAHSTRGLGDPALRVGQGYFFNRTLHVRLACFGSRLVSIRDGLIRGDFNDAPP